EIGVSGLDPRNTPHEKLPELLRTPTPERIFAIGDAMRYGMSVEEIYALSAIDPWFLREMRKIITMEREIGTYPTEDEMRSWKRNGFSDRQIARLTHRHENDVRKERHGLGVRPVYERVDTCAAEFEASTPYMYSTY